MTLRHVANRTRHKYTSQTYNTSQYSSGAAGRPCLLCSLLHNTASPAPCFVSTTQRAVRRNVGNDTGVIIVVGLQLAALDGGIREDRGSRRAGVVVGDVSIHRQRRPHRLGGELEPQERGW